MEGEEGEGRDGEMNGGREGGKNEGQTDSKMPPKTMLLFCHPRSNCFPDSSDPSFTLHFYRTVLDIQLERTSNLGHTLD